MGWAVGRGRVDMIRFYCIHRRNPQMQKNHEKFNYEPLLVLSGKRASETSSWSCVGQNAAVVCHKSAETTNLKGESVSEALIRAHLSGPVSLGLRQHHGGKAWQNSLQSSQKERKTKKWKGPGF